MQFSRLSLNTGRCTRLALAAAGGLLLGNLAACGAGQSDTPMINATLKVQAITQQGNCEDVGVKVSPVSILPGAPKLSNGKEFVMQMTLTKAADGVACTGEKKTIPMSPGKWKFFVMLPSGIASCERDIVGTGNLTVSFTDGTETCS